MIASATVAQVAKGSWAQQEFHAVDFGDARLNKRLVQIATDFAKQPDASIPKAAGNWAATKATYNFFNNDRVTEQLTLSSHVQATIARMSQQPVVLCVQDTTVLNFTTHPDTAGLGTIGSQQDRTLGIMVHDTMAFTPEAVALGLIDLQSWTRAPEEYGKKVDRKHKPIHQKESHKWLISFQATQQIQRQQPQTLLVNISDRESDIYEYFELATRPDAGAKVLVRANHNRRVAHPEQYLWEVMDKQLRLIGAP